MNSGPKGRHQHCTSRRSHSCPSLHPRRYTPLRQSLRLAPLHSPLLRIARHQLPLLDSTFAFAPAGVTISPGQ